MTVVSSFLFLISASLFSSPQSESSKAFSAEQIYTEPHNAAAAAIATQNYIVGHMAQECLSSRNSSGPIDDVSILWRKRNASYLSAAKIYTSNIMAYYERTLGPEKKQTANEEFVQSVVGQGAMAVKERLSSGDRIVVCNRFKSQVNSGQLDVKPGYPLYKELTELVQIINTFGT